MDLLYLVNSPVTHTQSDNPKACNVQVTLGLIKKQPVPAVLGTAFSLPPNNNARLRSGAGFDF
jgi:hypothetical protein